MKKFKLKNVTYQKTEWGYKATGECYNNPMFYDGQFIHTSIIKHITAKPAAIHTQNSIYLISKKDLPAENTELWSLLYGVELKEQSNAVHKTRTKSKVRKSTKSV